MELPALLPSPRERTSRSPVAVRPGTTTWRRPDEVLWRYTGDGVVVLSCAGGGPVWLSGAGGAVWEEVRDPGTTEDLVARVAARLLVDPRTARPAVLDVLTALARAGLLVAEDRG